MRIVVHSLRHGWKPCPDELLNELLRHDTSLVVPFHDAGRSQPVGCERGCGSLAARHASRFVRQTKCRVTPKLQASEDSRVLAALWRRGTHMALLDGKRDCNRGSGSRAQAHRKHGHRGRMRKAAHAERAQLLSQ